MYTQYWNLRARPFDDVVDADYFFANASHQGALLKLRYLVEQRQGVALLVGEHGAGKSLVTHLLERELGETEHGPLVRLVFPQLTAVGMLTTLAHRLGADPIEISAEHTMVEALEATLRQLGVEGRPPIIVVDDAHHLEIEQLNSLRLLLNFREQTGCHFSIVLVGRVDLLATVERVGALDQRIAVRTSIDPLSIEQTQHYVSHRLHIAGADRTIFDESAMAPLWELSQGNPRRINQICEIALLVGFVDELERIGGVEVEAAAEELTSVTGRIAA